MAPSIASITITALLLAAGAGACSCFRTDFATSYFSAQQRGTPLSVARVLGSYSDPPRQTGSVIALGGKRIYFLEVTLVYANCARATPYQTTAESAIGGSLCGLSLVTGQTYLLPLKPTGVSRISSCGVAINLASIPKDQKEFLARRELCCKGGCKCVDSERVYCKTPPCQVAKPGCKDVAKCVDNYCGGCAAELFKANGLPACTPAPFITL